MINEMGFTTTELYSSGATDQPYTLRKRNLGGAILLAAVQDYCSLDEEDHRSAELFLYPQTTEWQDHYDWAVALAEGMSPAWLRDALDRYKAKWDRQRFEQRAACQRRA